MEASKFVRLKVGFGLKNGNGPVGIIKFETILDLNDCLITKGPILASNPK